MEIAQKLGGFLAEAGAVRLFIKVDALELHESFPLIELHGSLTEEFDLRRCFAETDTHCHQVVQGGEPVGYAVTVGADRDIRIRQFNDTKEATAISRAIRFVDAQGIDDAYEAVLLDLRTHHVGAIVLIDDGYRPELTVPFRVPSNQHVLEVSRIYQFSEFLIALRRLPEFGGIRMDTAGMLPSDHQHES